VFDRLSACDSFNKEYALVLASFLQILMDQNVMSKICSTSGEGEKCIHNFIRQTSWEIAACHKQYW
jgi:hypothetical protein